MRLIDADALKEELAYKSQATEFDIDSVILGVIDEQPTASPWHRVEKRLPDDSRDVIIFTASGIMGVGSFIRPNWYQWYSGSGLPVDVTHWMPLPEQPKEDADANK